MLKNKLNSCQLTSKLGCSASDYTDCPQLESSGPIQPGKYKYPNILLVRARVSEPLPQCPCVNFEENVIEDNDFEDDFEDDFKDNFEDVF